MQSLAKSSWQRLCRQSDIISARTLDLLIWAFALWTIATELAVLLRGGLIHAVLFAIALCALLFLFRRFVFQGLFTLDESYVLENQNSSEMEMSLERIYCISFWLLVFIMVVLTMTAHRADYDDSTYINRAISAVEHPELPLMAWETRHDIPAIPIHPPISRLVSIHMLGALFYLLSGIPPIYFFHLVLPPLAVVLMALTYRRLFPFLLGKAWFWGVLSTFIFLILDGEVHRGFGNFSLVRLHQGKSILISVVVPLLIANTWRALKHYSPWTLCSLVVVLWAGLGLSTSALLICPPVLILSIIAYYVAHSEKRFSSRLPLLLGLLVAFSLLALLLSHIFIIDRYRVTASGTMILEKALKDMFGHPRHALGYFLIITFAWFFSPSKLGRFFFLITPISLTALMNPVSVKIISAHFTSQYLFWRVLFILPLPIMAGTMLSAPFHGMNRRLKPISRLVMGGILVLSLLLWSEHSIFSAHNRTVMKMPGLKVDQGYEVAALIVRQSKGRPNVLAPDSVSTWLPTFPHHPYPLLSRQKDIARLVYQARFRWPLKLYINGFQRYPDIISRLRWGLQRYHIHWVVVDRHNPWRGELEHILASSQFAILATPFNYRIWKRTTEYQQ